MTMRKPSRAGKVGKSGKTAAAVKSAYHHGDLPRAMVAEAVRTIQKAGIDALTLRGVGEQLGVSRTALYRHFANKDALLTAVAVEGFRLLQKELRDAWTTGGASREGFEAMGHAYVRFAVRHPSHYRVMFGSALPQASIPHPPAAGEGDAFGTLIEAVVTMQRDNRVRQDDPRLMSMFIWSVVHGVAMLAIDGVLPEVALEPLTRYANERIAASIAI